MKGRPKLPGAKRSWIQLRVTKEQKEEFKRKASELRKSLTGWILGKCSEN